MKKKTSQKPNESGKPAEKDPKSKRDKETPSKRERGVTIAPSINSGPDVRL